MTNENNLPPVNNHPLHQPDDSECSYIAPITKDELYQELDELLTAFCSDAQQQFCVDQEVIEWDDLERIRQTVQQVQTLLPTVDRNNNLQLRRALARAIHDILQHYGDACQQRNMRLLDEILTNQYIGDWHRLKQQWELKARENQHIFLILDDITLLTQSWLHHNATTNTNTSTNSNKTLVLLPSLSTLPHRLSTAKQRASTASSSSSGAHPKTTTTTASTSSSLLQSSTAITSSSSTAADILASILTTFDYPPGAYTVIVDKYNYGQLGLQHSKIGTRQIIFDSHQLSSSDIIETVNQICDVFASLFAATAHHHLAQIDTQVRKAQPFYTMTHTKRLAARIFYDGDPTTTTIISEDALDLENDDDGAAPPPPHHHYRHHLSSTSDMAPTTSSMSTPRLLSSSSSSSPPSPASSMAVLTPFRLSMTTPHMLWHHPIPIPSFAPAPWQLPDLLKSRHPYNPLFFGLFRRRTSTSISITSSSKRQQPSSFLKRAQPQHHLREPTESMPTTTKTTSTLRGKNTGYQHHHTALSPRASTAPHATTTTTTATGYGRNASENTSATGDGHASSAKIDDDNEDEADNYNASRFIHPRPSPSTNVPQRHSNNSPFNRTRQFVSQAMHGGGDGDDDATWNGTNRRHSNYTAAAPAAAITHVAPFTSVSVDKLSFHLGKMASQFYQDLLMHTRLRYQETQSGLQSLEWQMMDLYRHLQLASSRAVMQRAMMIVQELDEDDQHHYPPPQQHYDYGQRQVVVGTQNNNTSKHYEEDVDTSSSSSSDSSDDGAGNGNGGNLYGHHPSMTDRWTPICTDKGNEDEHNTPPLVYHSGTTTTTTESSASQQALRPTCTIATTDVLPPPAFDDNDDGTCFHTSSIPPLPGTITDSTQSSLPLPPPVDNNNKQQPQMQHQQNNPALSITSSFTTAAS